MPAKGLAAPDPEPARTVFTRLQLAATVEDGVLRTRELVGDLPYLTLRGNGSADLAESWLDLAMVAEVRNVPEIAQDPLAAELSGRSLPFRITGPLDSPALAVDIEALLKSEAAGMLLDKLLGTGEEEAGQSGGEGQERAGQRESNDGGSSAEPEEDPEDALKRAAAGALLQILGGQSSEEEEEDDGSG
jgi:AsmA protein